MINGVVKETHKMVWDFREKWKQEWPTPSRTDSALFAITELAEAIDAQLRLEKKYNRNSAKIIGVDEELADLALMLCTVIGPQWPSHLGESLIPNAYALDELILSVSRIYHECVRYEQDRAGNFLWFSMDAMAMIASKIPDLSVAVSEKLGKIEDRLEGRIPVPF